MHSAVCPATTCHCFMGPLIAAAIRSIPVGAVHTFPRAIPIRSGGQVCGWCGTDGNAKAKSEGGLLLDQILFHRYKKGTLANVTSYTCGATMPPTLLAHPVQHFSVPFRSAKNASSAAGPRFLGLQDVITMLKKWGVSTLDRR